MTAAATVNHDRTGTLLGGVRIQSVIRPGGFGVTYLAVDTKTDTRYVLKEVFPSNIVDLRPDGRVVPNATPGSQRLFESCRKQFVEEANILRRMPRHPGIVRIRGLFEKFGTSFVLMEMIDGRPFDEVLANHTAAGIAADPVDVCDLAIKLCEALGVVHQQGLVHADIKPANIMIRRQDFSPVLIDFGAARSMVADPDAVVMLTESFAPMEQLLNDHDRQREGIEIGPWTDLYALSVTLYKALTNTVPPKSKSRLEAMKAGQPDPYLPLASLLPNLPPGLAEAIDYGCSFLPGDRPANAEAFADLFRAVAAGQEMPIDRDSAELSTHIRFGSAPNIENLSSFVELVENPGQGIAAQHPPMPIHSQAAANRTPSGQAVSKHDLTKHQRTSHVNWSLWAVLFLISAIFLVLFFVVMTGEI